MEEALQPVTFTYALPFIQSFLANRGLTEYHIYIDASPQYVKAFLENTGEPFTTTVYDYIANKYKNDIFFQGIESDHDHGEFICLHFKSESAESLTTSVVTDLRNKYDNEWITHRIPSLLTMIKHNLNETPYLANAISHFQNENGFEETQCLINVYFDHLSIT